MEHRKFKRRLSELVGDLTAAQVRKLIDALSERDAGAEAQQLIDGRFRTDLKCRIARRGTPIVTAWRGDCSVTNA